MEPAAGFEPTTNRLEVCCAIRLHHAGLLNSNYIIPHELSDGNRKIEKNYTFFKHGVGWRGYSVRG